MFTFKQGDRPIDGFTIQRGVGRGGFGEVYYAVSDGGKEVALKYLRDNPGVELRGVSACLNLKSPYLVSILDVKQSADGAWFVVMEYIAGTSLRELMNASPGGLGPQKAAYLIREIGKGLTYLHDRGIVHRDLKPGNVFYDEGYVKIGDYGLSKYMTASQHSGQTVSVGTVHYMAPEIGSGNYDRTIDVYALGVMLYEMLLGKVPFAGATVGEILMKHLTAQPEVDALPAPFPEVIRKALNKDPKDRYATVPEMMAAMFTQAELDRSVAAFEPASLSAVAQRAMKNVAVAARAGVGSGSSNVGGMYHSSDAPPVVDQRRGSPLPGQPGRNIPVDAQFAARIEHGLHEAAKKVGGKRLGNAPFPPRSRLKAGLLGLFLGAFGIHRFYMGYTALGVFQILVTFFTGIGALWGIVEGIMILAGSEFADAYGRPLVSADPRDRSVIMRAVYGFLGTVFILGAIATAAVGTFVQESASRATLDGPSEIRFNSLRFLYLVSAALIGLGSFGIWKSAHRSGFAFWRATIRPGIMCFLLALGLAALAFHFALAYGAAEATISSVVSIAAFVAFVVFWHLRGPEGPAMAGDLYWDSAWKRLFGAFAIVSVVGSVALTRLGPGPGIVNGLHLRNVDPSQLDQPGTVSIGKEIERAGNARSPWTTAPLVPIGLLIGLSCFVESRYRARRLKSVKGRFPDAERWA